MHNAIAHQDYALGGRVNVVEKPDQLVFSNVAVLPGKVESLLDETARPNSAGNRP